MSENPVVIVGAKRTTMGAFRGSFSALSATQLGAIALQGALKQSGVSPTKVSSVFMGCVLSAGLGQSPTRQASLQAGISVSTPTTHINKVCGSALQAILNGVQELMLQDNGGIIAAGGMENMTNAFYLLTEARQGYRLGYKKIVDHLLFDGLEDAESHQVMGFLRKRQPKNMCSPGKCKINMLLKVRHGLLRH